MASPSMTTGDQETVRVVQFSDCHVSGDPGAKYRGADARQALSDCLSLLNRDSVDLLIGSGDLSEDYSEASYLFLRKTLDLIGLPFVTLPGNHDDAALQRRMMGACPVGRPIVRDLGAWRLVLLNSAVEGEVPGKLSSEMLSSLETVLRDWKGPKAVFLHHQPIPVGSPWIDRYPLRHPGSLWEILDAADGVRFVAWGHIHQPFTARRGSMHLFGAPSTAVNSLPGRETFTEDPRGPACRWFELSPGGGIATGILGAGWETGNQPFGSSNQRMM